MAEDTKPTTQTPPEDPRTFKELQAELASTGFVGAEFLTTRSAVLAVMKGLEKKEADAKKNDVQNTPTDPVADKVKDDVKKDEKQWQSKAQRMKEHLDKQPKVQFLIPLGIGEKKGTIETWQANGYRLNILKGVLVTVPQQVATSLAESYQLTQEAGSDFAMDREVHRDDSPYKTVAEALE